MDVVLGDKLCSRTNVKSLKWKLSQSCFILYRSNYYLDTSTLRMVYHTLVYPLIQYCITVWGSISSCYLTSIMYMQNKNCEIYLSFSCSDPDKFLIWKTALMKLNEVFDLKVCKWMQSTLSVFDVDHISFIPVYSFHLHDTKCSRKLNFVGVRPRIRLDIFKIFRFLIFGQGSQIILKI